MESIHSSFVLCGWEFWELLDASEAVTPLWSFRLWEEKSEGKRGFYQSSDLLSPPVCLCCCEINAFLPADLLLPALYALPASIAQRSPWVCPLSTDVLLSFRTQSGCEPACRVLVGLWFWLRCVDSFLMNSWWGATRVWSCRPTCRPSVCRRPSEHPQSQHRASVCHLEPFSEINTTNCQKPTVFTPDHDSRG